MIGSLRGTLLDVWDTELLLEVGGVGYRVQVTPGTVKSAGPVGGETFVHVHHHRRDDAEVLFGFTTSDDRRVFEQLISTHGVGPSLGLAILGTHTPDVLRRIIATDDVGALCLVPGVGRKTAQRLLVELKSKLELPDTEVASSVAAASGDAPAAALADVRDALAGLGYSPEEIAGAIADLEADGDASELLRVALRRLAAG